MNLAQALRNPCGKCLAFVGAGGKTTALFQLARQLVSTGRTPQSVLVTTTTHLATWQCELADVHLRLQPDEEAAELASRLSPGVILVSGPEGEDERLAAPSSEVLQDLRNLAAERGLPLLIEADGGRGLPLKAPAGHEPVLPPSVDVVVVTAGLSGLGKPLSPQWVHRPQIFGALGGLAEGEAITPQALSRVLLDSRGGLKGVPAGARRVALLNQADTPELQAQAHALAPQLLTGYQAVLAASLGKAEGSPGEQEAAPGGVFAAHEAVAGVVLAAGGSARFGQPKQLLLWQGEPLVRRAALTALQAGLSPVVIVVGAAEAGVRQAVTDLPVTIAPNPEWEGGQSTSLRAGLERLPSGVGAAIFLLADQPAVSAPLVTGLVDAHARGLYPLVAPLVDGRRGNPVLVDSELFEEVRALRGDVGGRALFSRHPLHYLPWHDSSLLLDIDTPEDYQRLLERGA